MIRCFRN